MARISDDDWDAEEAAGTNEVKLEVKLEESVGSALKKFKKWCFVLLYSYRLI